MATPPPPATPPSVPPAAPRPGRPPDPPGPPHRTAAAAAAAARTRALGRAFLDTCVLPLGRPSPSTTALLGRSRRRWVRALPYAAAFVLAVVLFPTTAQVLAHDYGLAGALAAALGLAQAAPLLLAVTRPLPAWWIVFGADVLGALVLLGAPHPSRLWPWPPGAIVGYLALCLALALRESRRTLIAVYTATVLVSLGLAVAFPDRNDATNLLLSVLSGIVLFLGAAVRERGDAQRRLAEQETISEAERARRTLLEERARIARELHDVVAHHMSVITVQADSAPYRLPELPPAAREEFDSIAATARASLSEMRRLLGVLRSEESGGERAPQPGLERLARLVEATVRAGVPARLASDVPAEGPGAPPRAVQLSAYRIVQEALANVVRHAPGAVTHVSVRESYGYAADGAADGETPADPGVAVLVVNDPSPRPGGPPLETTGTGHGLPGMRERVRLLGGTLTTGPLPGGGYRVAAWLPARPGPAPAPPGAATGHAHPARDATDAPATTDGRDTTTP